MQVNFIRLLLICQSNFPSISLLDIFKVCLQYQRGADFFAKAPSQFVRTGFINPASCWCGKQFSEVPLCE